MEKKTTEQFIREAINIHGEKYDYSQVEYLGSHIKVKIFCKVHNEYFHQAPSTHLKSGCRLCGFDASRRPKKYTQESFIREASEVHNNKYDYSLVKYDVLAKKLDIICTGHGVFSQTGHNHLSNKEGCPVCAKNAPHRGGTYYNRTLAERNISSWTKQDCSIYLADLGGGLFKIGISSEIPKRFRKIKNESGITPQLVGCTTYNRWYSVMLEDFLHKHYKNKRVTHPSEFAGRTEVFKLDQNDIDYICILLNDKEV